MTSEEFYQLAKKLWGDEWATVLAHKFEVRPKSVKRWANGKNEIPEAVVLFIQFQMARQDA